MALRTVSPIASLINLGAISLERTHATFRPFNHRLVKKKIFQPMLLLFGLQLGQFQLALSHNLPLNLHFINDTTSYLFCLLTIIVSYSSMAIATNCLTTVVQPIEEENWPRPCSLWQLYLYCWHFFTTGSSFQATEAILATGSAKQITGKNHIRDSKECK